MTEHLSLIIYLVGIPIHLVLFSLLVIWSRRKGDVMWVRFLYAFIFSLLWPAVDMLVIAVFCVG